MRRKYRVLLLKNQIKSWIPMRECDFFLEFANSAQFQNIFCLNVVFGTKYENVPENHIRWRP
jgi:hypothetical protein